MIECIGDGATELLGRVVAQHWSCSHYIKKVEVQGDEVHWTVSRKPSEALLSAMLNTRIEYSHNYVHILDASAEPTDDVQGGLYQKSDHEPWWRGVITDTFCGRVEIYVTEHESDGVLHKVVVDDYGKRSAFIISLGAEWASFHRAMSRAMELIP